MSKLLAVAALFLSLVSPMFSEASPLACERLLAEQDGPSVLPWFQQIQFQKIEEALKSSQIIAVQDLHEALKGMGKKPSGNTVGMALITFKGGIQAIWKPGERNLIEVSAYKAARLVGSKLVPPTVERTLVVSDFDGAIPVELARELSGQQGSLQFFVHTSFDLLELADETRTQVWEKVQRRQKAERDIFNFVFGNWDLHWGNILIDDSYSIVQIDNGAIRSHLKVRFGELPFVRRLNFSREARAKQKGLSVGPFPFDSAIYLDNPTIQQFISLVQEQADPDALDRFVYERTVKYKTKNLTMKVAFWDGAIWTQGIGFQNYGPIKPKQFPKELLIEYGKLTYESLRQIFPESIYNDKQIFEILERRDQIMVAAEKFENDSKEIQQ